VGTRGRRCRLRLIAHWKPLDTHVPNQTALLPTTLFWKTRLTKEVDLPTTRTKRHATAKLAATAHDLAAYHVRGEDALTNICIAVARHAWQACPQTFSHVLGRNLQVAIARLRHTGAESGCESSVATRLTAVGKGDSRRSLHNV